jgi:arrestin-related trafficking adapter 4/5/7
MEVLERLGLETAHTDDQHFATTLPDKVVASVEQNMPQNTTRQLVDESSGLLDESYQFRVVLPLKRSLNSCRQSVVTDHIRVHHNLKVFVNIHNPDGHISQLCLRNLIHLYISPSTPINDDQSIATPLTAVRNPLGLEEAFDPTPPPTYGTHLLDQLYEDIDTSGYISGITTPYNFLSRAQSSENLHVFPPLAAPQSAEQSDSGSNRSSSSINDAAAIQLQTRLQALRDRRPSIASIAGDTPIATQPPQTVPSANNSPRLDPAIFIDQPANPSAPHSNRNSSILHRRSQAISLRNSMHLTPNALAPLQPGTDIVQQRTAPPTQLMFNLAELNRVPSYNAAVNATPPAVSSSGSETLPSYDFAVGLAPHPSAPPTPPADSDDSGAGTSGIAAASDMQSPPSSHQGGHGSGHARHNSKAVVSHIRRSPSPPLMLCDAQGLSNYATEIHHPLGSSFLNAPQRAHVRGQSVGAVHEHVLQAEQQGQRRGSAAGLAGAIGGGSLHALWNGMRRGSVT